MSYTLKAYEVAVIVASCRLLEAVRSKAAFAIMYSFALLGLEIIQLHRQCTIFGTSFQFQSRLDWND
jgi:hypothetical protein